MFQKRVKSCIALLLAVVLVVLLFPQEFRVKALDDTTKVTVTLSDSDNDILDISGQVTLTLESALDNPKENEQKSVEVVEGKAVFEGFVELGEDYVVSISNIPEYTYESKSIEITERITACDMILMEKEQFEITGKVVGEEGIPDVNVQYEIYEDDDLKESGLYCDGTVKTSNSGEYTINVYENMTCVVEIQVPEHYEYEEAQLGTGFELYAEENHSYVYYDVTEASSLNFGLRKAQYTTTFKGQDTDNNATAMFSLSGQDYTHVDDDWTIVKSYGSSFTYNIVAAQGYHIVNVYQGSTMLKAFDGQNTSSYSGSISNLRNDSTIMTTLDTNKYKITTKHGTNVSITESMDDVPYGEDVTLQIVPDDGYAITELTINGSSIANTDYVDGVYNLTINEVSVDYNVEVKVKEMEVVNVDSWSDLFQLEIDPLFLSRETETEVEDTYVLRKNGAVTLSLLDTMADSINGFSLKGTLGNDTTIEVSASQVIERAVIKTVDNRVVMYNFAKDLCIIADKTAPQISDVVVSEQGWTNADVTISGTVTDNAGSDGPSAGIEKVVWSKVSLEDSDVEECSNTCQISGNSFSMRVSEEDNTGYYIYAIDSAGNVTSGYGPVTVCIDKTAPNVTEVSVDSSTRVYSYGLYSQDKMDLEVKMTESEGESGLSKVNLYYEVSDESSEDILFRTYELNEHLAATKTIYLANTETLKFAGGAVYITIEDVAGNVSERKYLDEVANTNVLSRYVTISGSEPIIEIEETISPACVTGELEKKWFRDHSVVSVTLTDDMGIRSATVKINGMDISIDAEGEELQLSYNDIMKSTTFLVDSEGHIQNGRNELTINVENLAGTSSEETYVFYIDEIVAEAIEMNITYGDDPGSRDYAFYDYGNFFNDTIILTITAKDNENGSGVKNITVSDSTASKEYVNERSECDYTIHVQLPEDEVTEVAGLYFFDEIKIGTLDYAGNNLSDISLSSIESTSVTNDTIMIENIKPNISIEQLTETSYIDEESRSWISCDTNYEIELSDTDSGIASYVVKLNGIVLAEDYAGEPLNTIFTEYEEVVKNETITVSTKQAIPDENNCYKLEVTLHDNAGNTSESVRQIYIDNLAPEVVDFEFYAMGVQEGTDSVYYVKTDYGYYFVEDTQVVITATDTERSSGLSHIDYYLVDIDNGESTVESQNIVNGEITLMIPANFKGQIYALAYDNVLNSATDENGDGAFVTPESVIVEKKSLHDSTEHISLTLEKTPYKDMKGNSLYSSNTSVNVAVNDFYSGIRSIEWKVISQYDSEQNQSGVITLDNNRMYTESSESDGWEVKSIDENLVTALENSIYVCNDSNDIVIWVKLVDRAGNTSEKSVILSIDKTLPVIEVTYDNYSDDTENEGYYAANRLATITVFERNFDVDGTSIRITNTDGVIPTLTSWKKTENTLNPDQCKYVSTILFSADGDYTLEVMSEDSCKNIADTYIDRGFTIDKTLPELTIEYESESKVKNEKYFSSKRIATVTIEEHNFDQRRVDLTQIAEFDGNEISKPSLSSWSSVGDVHVATIEYSEDGDYFFDIAFCDMAGNSITQYTPDEFVIDTVAPDLLIEELVDQFAYNGEVLPVLDYEDVNIDEKKTLVTLVGVYNGDISLASVDEAKAHGKRVTILNFEDVSNAQTDDIYDLVVTLEDMAGNVTTQAVRFSVNRFGSVYEWLNADAVSGKWLGVASITDIIVSETNVNELVGSKLIKLIHGNETRNLAENVDYTVKEEVVNNGWSRYTYTINKTCFSGDGMYLVQFVSSDNAGNTNENEDEAKLSTGRSAEISFGVDTTNPTVMSLNLDDKTQYPNNKNELAEDGSYHAVFTVEDNESLSEVRFYLNEELVTATSEGTNYELIIPVMNEEQYVRIEAVDKAGNKLEYEIDDFLVTTNVIVRWVNNTPLFIGSIVGLFLVLGMVTFLMIRIKEKKHSR